ncbi:FAD-dependent oxidoreductase [Pseudomonas sp. PDM16]|uniref:NAD(P)/FAD-dependent oxidoreductase n=1 Tax=Pseudomonas sp. PDM16 TaxID=2769292 RepID=UPI00177ABB5D|nr:NAD(P)/FAD-dependent oxidoreductase [Pseudomonas sp. PDM16]MBD9414208.1 FAD-dependent oxidoreductase [Pseudomonas sp. PDM16]
MARLSRRALLAGLALLPWWARAGQGRVTGRVLVVGGGFAGATAARLLRQAEPGLDVVLIEPKVHYHTCPMSNRVIAGLDPLARIAWSYRDLEGQGVRLLHQAARDIDTAGRRVQLDDGLWLDYDHLILAPGIDMRFDAIEGYDAAAAKRLPHAWQAGVQTELLRRQLQAMTDGGLVLIGVPDNPYRCPPGPYERASLIADYLKRHKPRSKLLILDAKDSFSKQALFQQGWQRHYPGLVEWVGHAGDGRVVRADAQRRELECEFGNRHRAAVINLIPPQRAAAIAVRAGLTDASGWVPVDPQRFRARTAEHITVLGDASIAAPMPKSAFSAQAQARLAVAHLLAELRGEPLQPPVLSNTCYSLLTPDDAVSISARYRVEQGLLGEVPGTLQLSPLDGDDALRRHEAQVAAAWYLGICTAAWGAPA